MALWTLLVYAAAGLLIAVALARRERLEGLRRALPFALHAVLWPLFVPVLLPQPSAAPPPAPPAFATPIDQAERSLESALLALGRDLSDPLSIEAARVRALGAAMRAAAGRLAELDGLLAAPGHDEAALAAELAGLEREPDRSGLAEILAQRLSHVRRLADLRRQTQKDLERAIARAGELATRLALLRYEDPRRSGAAATRARELTDSIEELCRVLNEARAA